MRNLARLTGLVLASAMAGAVVMMIARSSPHLDLAGRSAASRDALAAAAVTPNDASDLAGRSEASLDAPVLIGAEPPASPILPSVDEALWRVEAEPTIDAGRGEIARLNTELLAVNERLRKALQRPAWQTTVRKPAKQPATCPPVLFRTSLK